jgi:hypothetical protein
LRARRAIRDALIVVSIGVVVLTLLWIAQRGTPASLDLDPAPDVETLPEHSDGGVRPWRWYANELDDVWRDR